MFPAKIMLAAALLAFQVAGTPVTVPPTEELVVISSEITPVGTLTYYGRVAGAANVTSDVASVCSSGNLACTPFGANAPDANTCATLIETLQDNPGQAVVPQPPLAICLLAGSRCCVSWRDPIPGLTRGHLVPSAKDILNSCVTRGFSGSISDTNLNGFCTTECLSNIADGC
ncbi:hypothetical protein AURDEDRAFT_171196 [Auricularia subglabra TFB-10046 SS5]|uniref:WD-like domain-containing protein n=1 Tax=Auricularia subglabra (strain TFB-10046 / SS5) TaxID=717982 RepID=J0WXN8_AURST|nr:hypothetical protein AURDEDRAFT_171196 [Auricularia subglabra TFB-10046 SS5]